MDLENRSRYNSLKARWKTLDSVVSKEYVPPHDLFYLAESEGEESEIVNGDTSGQSEEDEALIRMLDITGKVGHSVFLKLVPVVNIILFVKHL